MLVKLADTVKLAPDVDVEAACVVATEPGIGVAADGMFVVGVCEYVAIVAVGGFF